MQPDETPASACVRREELANELRQLKTKVTIYTLGYMLVAGTVYLGATLAVSVPAVRWLMAAREAAAPGEQLTLAHLAGQQPLILVGSWSLLVLGGLLAVAGMYGWQRILGPERRPPRRLVLLVAVMPLSVAVLGSAAAAVQGTLQLCLLTPIALGGSLVMAPGIVGVIGCGTLLAARGVVGKRFEEIPAEELPEVARDHFDQQDQALGGLGLHHLYDLKSTSLPNRFRRVWYDTSGTMFASAEYIVLGQRTIFTVGFSSAAEDGTYFEASNAPAEFARNLKGMERQIQVLPDADVVKLLRAHLGALEGWIEETGARPLQFRHDDALRLSDYGLAWLFRRGREMNPRTELAWLVDPYLGRDLPELPGVPYEASEEVEQPEELFEDEPEPTMLATSSSSTAY